MTCPDLDAGIRCPASQAKLIPSCEAPGCPVTGSILMPNQDVIAPEIGRAKPLADGSMTSIGIVIEQDGMP